MATLGNLVYKIQAKNDNFKRKMDESEQKIQKFSRRAKKIGGALTAVAAGIGIVSFNLAKMASDANEIQSRFDHVFGELSDDANEWAENFAESFGQSRSEVKSMMATLQDTLVPMGVAKDKAYKLNKQITQLAIDMSSFVDVPLEKAMSDIQSALVGQSEPMRKYGSILTATRVKQYALAEGIIETDRELTEQEKIIARVQLMFEDMTKATGDYKRTQDSFANQLRVTKNTLKNIGETIGKNVLPVFKDLLGYVKDVLEWFQDLPDATQKVISKWFVWSGIVAGIVGPLALIVGFLPKIIGFLPQIAAGLSMISGAATPLLVGGVVIAGVIALIAAFRDLKTAQRKQLRQQRDNLENTKALVTEYEDLKDKEKLSADEKDRLKEISRDLADIYPDAVRGIDDETDAYNINTKAVKENIETKGKLIQLEETKIKIKSLRDNIVELSEANDELRKTIDEDINIAQQLELNQASLQLSEVAKQMGLLDEKTAELSLEEIFKLEEMPDFEKQFEQLTPQMQQI